MKKTLVISSLLLTTSLMAVDTKYFVGAGAESISAHYKTTTQPSTEIVVDENNYSDIALKLKAGVILNSAHRVSLSHVKFSQNEINPIIILANYDYLIPVPMNNVFRSYFGVHAGRLEINESNTNISDVIYGVQAGIIYDITKHVEFELGVDYTTYNYNKAVKDTLMGTNFDGKVEINNSISIYSGLNYKF